MTCKKCNGTGVEAAVPGQPLGGFVPCSCKELVETKAVGFVGISEDQFRKEKNRQEGDDDDDGLVVSFGVKLEDLSPEVQALIEAGEKAGEKSRPAMCGVCLGVPLASGLECICSDSDMPGLEAGEMIGLRRAYFRSLNEIQELKNQLPSAPVVKEPVIGLDEKLKKAYELLEVAEKLWVPGDAWNWKVDVAKLVRPGIFSSPPEPPKETDRRCSHWIRWPHECDDCLEDARKFLKAPKATDHVDGERREG